MEAGAHGPGVRLAGRIGRHAAAYGGASIAATLGGVVSVVVFTRFLEPSEFGKLAVLSTMATVVTAVATLGVMQGTMRRVFGTTGDEELGEMEEGEAKAVSSDPRLALSTGFALTLTLGALLLLAAWVWQRPLADLVGRPDEGALILLAVGAGVAGAVMRLASYILRLQLRSSAYLAIALVQAVGTVAVAIPLLAVGLGIEAPLIAFLAGNAVAAALSLPLLRLDLRPAVSAHEAAEILRGGLRYLPIMISFQSIQLGDTLLVARFGSFGDTGMYRVAQRIAMPISYGTSVFQQAWGPMKRDLTQVAVDRVDESRLYTARLVTFYAVFVTALILSVAVLADQLAALAASEYGDAAELVPLTTVGIAGHGMFVFAYRTARLPLQIAWMIGLSTLAALLFAGLAALLIPALGAVGAPLAAIAGWGTATLVMLTANQMRGKPVPFEYGKLLALALLTVATWACAHWLLPDTTLGTVGKLALLLAWAGTLLATRIVPLGEVRALTRFAHDSTGEESSRQLRARIGELNGLDAALVDKVLRQGGPPRLVAGEMGMSEEEVLACTVQALRTAATGGGEPREADVALGELLLVPRPRAERDKRLLELAEDGADPIDVDTIKRAAAVATMRRR
jgi:O-antigen/teichoic acid export membrane protein